ncbi:unnamed protein product [Colias eurytheme]|nr:unnamed protein product [Colias eurytheme]
MAPESNKIQGSFNLCVSFWTAAVRQQRSVASVRGTGAALLPHRAFSMKKEDPPCAVLTHRFGAAPQPSSNA